ncbi:hypothetical protein, partial [Staphylococcus aureus]|uniref:hypothetical protein n=1 Tax=Staphylococcus aureus TaxID=1280 RepID=UPI0039BE6711
HLLRKAIDAYETVYDRDSSATWHGINAASCRLRAYRDGADEPTADRARAIADRVLERLRTVEVDLQKKEAQLPVWDLATRVEALAVLGRMDE